MTPDEQIKVVEEAQTLAGLLEMRGDEPYVRGQVISRLHELDVALRALLQVAEAERKTTEEEVRRLRAALEEIVDRYEHATADLDAFEDHGGHVGIARHDRAVLQGLGTCADLARAALEGREP